MRHRRYSFNSEPPEVQARNSARQKARWEAQDLSGAAYKLCDSAKEHTEAELTEAISLYEKARKLYELLGDHERDVRFVQLAIDACKTTLAAHRATMAIKAPTGTE